MKISYCFTSPLLFLFFLVTSSLIFSSFSTLPIPISTEERTPIKKRKITKQERQQQQFQKRSNRLHQRFEQTTNSKKRARLQQKIRKVEQQQEGNPGLVFGLIAFILAVITSFFILYAAIVFIQQSGTIELIISFILIAIVVALALLSYISAKKSSKKPRKGFALTALILSGAGLLILIAALFA